MKVLELLAKPEAWTKGTMARDKDDNAIDPLDPNACKFCLSGALARCYEEPARREALAKLLVAINSVLPQFGVWITGTTVPGFNDYMARGHEDILKVVRLANI